MRFLGLGDGNGFGKLPGIIPAWSVYGFVNPAQ